MAALLRHLSRGQKHSLLCRRSFYPPLSSLQEVSIFTSSPVRFLGTATEHHGFNDMMTGNQRKYYMLGGKGGVGKTSCAASLAVKFANHGHPTIVVSTDPAHSLSDSFGQDLTGGRLVPVEGVDSPLYALEINPEKSMEEFHAASQSVDGGGLKNIMESMGLGMIANQLGDLKLEELLHTIPPGTDEIIAISKVVHFLESSEYDKCTRIVFDTAPTGHTLRLLSLPEFLDGSIGKVVKLKKKLSSTFKSLFGKEEAGIDSSDKLETLKGRMAKVRELFQDSDTTEFIIVTIPTVMLSFCFARLLAAGIEMPTTTRSLISLSLTRLSNHHRSPLK